MHELHFSGPDASALLAQMKGRQLAPESVVRSHLHRLEAQHAQLNAACVVLRERALKEAASPRPGPLAGLPVTVKENFALAGQQITLGSQRKPAMSCAEDALVVQRLRAAGAIIIARSNVPEFLMNAETDNLRYGRTNNPLNLARTCGGSSGGEAALVASGASAMGFGTDILGSIRIPAAFCGLVGLRPHSQAVDKRGIEPVSGDFFESWNGVGPLTRSVRDARLAYSVIADAPPAPAAEVAGRRLILAQNFPLRVADAPIQQAWLAAVAELKAMGMQPQQEDFASVRGLFTRLPALVCNEMAPLWQAWLSPPGQPFSLTAELGRLLLRRPSMYPGLLPWLISARVLPRSGAGLAKLVAYYQRARSHYRGLLGEDGILCLPTLGLLAPPHGQMNRRTLLRPGLNGLVTAHTFANYIDLSSISVPAPRFRDPTSGLMPGIMLLCAPGNEGGLLDAAAALEQALAPASSPH